jgi:hypothetical protein
VDCPTLLKTIVVSSFLSRSSDIILNAWQKAYFL